VSEADFLFGQEIIEYIDEIYKHGLELWRWNEEYLDSTQLQPEGYDHNKVVKGKHKELEWFVEQPNRAKEKFKKYLYIGK
jgi:hypothetical protein